ncbi:hypothetical protein VULLAG_LOCUS20695 [Vulpes lagopus]
MGGDLGPCGQPGDSQGPPVGSPGCLPEKQAKRLHGNAVESNCDLEASSLTTEESLSPAPSLAARLGRVTRGPRLLLGSDGTGSQAQEPIEPRGRLQRKEGALEHLAAAGCTSGKGTQQRAERRAAISWPYPISWPPLCPTPVFLSTEARVHSDLPTPSGLITYSPHPSPCSNQDGLLLTTGSRQSSVLRMIKRLVLSLPSGLDSNHFL